MTQTFARSHGISIISTWRRRSTSSLDSNDDPQQQVSGAGLEVDVMRSLKTNIKTPTGIAGSGDRGKGRARVAGGEFSVRPGDSVVHVSVDFAGASGVLLFVATAAD